MSKVLTGGDPPEPATLQAAADALRGGLVVGLPTDTVYGVAVAPGVAGATGALFALKGRPRTAELPVLVAGEEQLAGLVAEWPAVARRLVERHWPGPLTIVLRRRPELAWDLGGDGTTIGVRCPDHPVAMSLCRIAGPLATTSANRHGQPPVTTAAGLLRALPGIGLVIDGGPCEGAPSTVVDCTTKVPKVLRAGRLSPAELAGP
ncbi:MAG: L-threonylcarbamoyladenylate synthase [Acidimicrobiales bacterium]